MVCDISLERSQQVLQLFLKPHLNQRFEHKVMGPQSWEVVGVPTLGISRLPLGSRGTKCHLDVGPVARHKVYYKGEGVGFPQVRAMVSFVSPSLPVVHLNTKMFQLCSNQLVVWFVHVCVSD